jgi:hypothetical protein
MSKKTLFLIFALFLITSVLLVVAFYQPQISTTSEITPTPQKPVAQTILSFGKPTMATSSSAITSNYSIPIEISTGENKVTAVQLELQYDPEVLGNILVVPGQFFSSSEILLNQIDAKTGRISYALGVGLTAQGISGKGIVANILFSPKIKTGDETAILFLPKTLVTATGVTESALKETTNGMFTFGEKVTSPITPIYMPNQ